MARFNLVNVKKDNDGTEVFFIHDTQATDGSWIDACTEPEIMKYLGVGIQIGGITPVPEQNTFSYTDEFFVEFEEETDEDDYADNDLGYDDDEDDDDYSDLSSEEEVEESEADFDDSEEDDYDISSETDEDEYEDDLGYGDIDDEEDDYSDFCADDDIQDSFINKFYDLFDQYVTSSDLQVKNQKGRDLLKSYYLWSSQILFEGADTSIGRLQLIGTAAALKKQELLNEMRAQGQEWVYAGYVDLEVKGNGFCTLNHPLRYKHFAWDVAYTDVDNGFWGDDYTIDWAKINSLVKSRHVIEFGIQCVGDFFNVDKETMSAIKSEQRNAIEEMKHLYEIYQDPQKIANAKASFKVFELFADAYSATVRRQMIAETNQDKIDKLSRIDKAIFSFYKKFKDAGAVYPRSLVKRMCQLMLKRNFLKWSGGSKSLDKSVVHDNIRNLNILSGITGYKPKGILEYLKNSSIYDDVYSSFVRAYLENLLTLQTSGIYAFNPYSDYPRDRDEGGNNKNSRSYFNAITGVVERDGNAVRQIMQTYANYPMLFNQISTRYFTIEGDFDEIRFDIDYLKLVDRYAGLLAKYKSLRDTDQFKDKFREFNAYGHERYVSEYTVDEYITKKLGSKTQFKYARVGTKSRTNTPTLASVCDELEQACIKAEEVIKEATEHYEQEYAKEEQAHLKQVAEHEDYLKKKAEQEKLEEERAKVEYENRQKSMRNDFETVVNEFKQAVASNTQEDFELTDAKALSILTYVKENSEEGVKALNEFNSLILKIHKTVSNQTYPASRKQMYHLLRGAKHIVTKEANGELNILNLGQANTGANTNGVVEETSTTEVQETGVVETAPAVETAIVEEQPTETAPESAPVVEEPTPVEEPTSVEEPTPVAEPVPVETPEPTPVEKTPEPVVEETKPVPDTTPAVMTFDTFANSNVGNKFVIYQDQEFVKTLMEITSRIDELKSKLEDKLQMLKVITAVRDVRVKGYIMRNQVQHILTAKQTLGL